MKVLSIGNSFSTDAHKYLHILAENNGFDLLTFNLFIGGCDLETHWLNARDNNAFYEYEINGGDPVPSISIAQALESNNWDIVTFQQASRLSGLPESIEPYLTLLADFVRERQPKAKLYYHQTWAYETDSDHTGFLNYNNNQHTMYNCIKLTAQQAAKSIGADIITVGDVIQRLRDTTREFDYKNGGITLCRDGFHLSNDYGRFTAAATWLHTFTEKKILADSFDDFDTLLLNIILNAVNN